MPTLRLPVVAFAACVCWTLPAWPIVVTLDDPGLADPFVPTDSLPPPAANPDVTVSGFNLATAYQNAYGVASPNTLPRVGFAENESVFAMVLQNRGGAAVVASQTIGFTITGDYWTITAELVFNPGTAVLFDPNDELTLRGDATHTGLLSGPGIPHPGDAASGPTLPYSVTANAGNKTEQPSGLLGVGDGDLESGVHPDAGHNDVVRALIFATVFTSFTGGIAFFDDITSWIAQVEGVHIAEPGPETMLALAAGVLILWRRRRV